jgi:anti-anti-sigma factor
MAVSLPSVYALSPSTHEGSAIPQIEVCINEKPAEVVIRLAGEASFRQADELTTALLCLSALRPPLFTLDLSGLGFVSSLAMGVLVSFRRAAVRAGCRVRLASALQEPVRAALARAELLTLFDWHEATAGCAADAA